MASTRPGQRFSSMFSASSNCLSSRIWSSTSRMVKSDLSPTISAWRRRIFTPMEWNVPSHGMPSTTPPTMLADSGLHLARRLVGEGDGQNLAGPGAAGRQNMGDAHGEHAGLAGTGAGQHQHRAVGASRPRAAVPGRPRGAQARPLPACARAAMPPGAGPDGAVGSIVRFKGSAKVTDGADSHAPKMASGRGFSPRLGPVSSFRGAKRKPASRNP